MAKKASLFEAVYNTSTACFMIRSAGKKLEMSVSGDGYDCEMMVDITPEEAVLLSKIILTAGLRFV